MKIKMITIIIFLFLATGCVLDPYTKSKYGEQVVDAWYSYSNDFDNLGKIRKEVENIYSIEDRTCQYIIKYKSNYIFKCTITYKEISDTIIPFSDAKTLNVYAVFTPTNKDTYTYKIYNSKSEKGIWESDEDLK